MKVTNYLLIILLAGAFALAGCGKSSKPPPSGGAGGMDVAKLEQMFPSPSPDLQASFGKLRFCTRYRQYDNAIVELDKIARQPNLTDAQKQAVSDLVEQVKKAMAAAPAKPAQ